MPIVQGISVLLPTNKINDWLNYSVNSLLNSLNVQFEIVLILDGVCFEKEPEWLGDPRIRVVQIMKSHGLPYALNFGIANAKYSLIARLDADDLASPQRLALQHSYLAEHPEVAAVGCRVMRIDEDGKEIGELNGPPTNQDLRKSLLLRNVVAHPALAFRTSCLKKIGNYNEQMIQMEDYEFILRLGLCGEIHNIDSVGLYYRIHSSQMSRTFNANKESLRAVTIAKYALATQLKVSKFSAFVLVSIWKIAEISRSLGLRKPRYIT